MLHFVLCGRKSDSAAPAVSVLPPSDGICGTLVRQTAGAAVPGKDGTHPGISGIPAGQKGGTGKRSYRRRGKHRREQHAVRRHLVDVRSSQILRAHAVEVAVALIVGHDKNDVRFPARSIHTSNSFPFI